MVNSNISLKVQRFLNENPNLETPFVIFDLSILKDKYHEFKTNFPNIDVYYAVKCNPAKQVLTTLDSLGCWY
jgi:diaminopimelate decarboxylase